MGAGTGRGSGRPPTPAAPGAPRGRRTTTRPSGGRPSSRTSASWGTETSGEAGPGAGLRLGRGRSRGRGRGAGGAESVLCSPRGAGAGSSRGGAVRGGGAPRRRTWTSRAAASGRLSRQGWVAAACGPRKSPGWASELREGRRSLVTWAEATMVRQGSRVLGGASSRGRGQEWEVEARPRTGCRVDRER